MSELASNLFDDYTRFKKEMVRAKEIANFFLLFEFPLESVLIYPNGSGIPRRKWPYLVATPRKILERLNLLYQSYNVKSIFCNNRHDAEKTTADILQLAIDGGDLSKVEFFISEIKNE